MRLSEMVPVPILEMCDNFCGDLDYLPFRARFRVRVRMNRNFDRRHSSVLTSGSCIADRKHERFDFFRFL